MLSQYLFRSFRRKPLRHFSLFWVLMCAFMLPLVVSVYRDSLDYGRMLQNRNFTKDQAIHISGAQPEDVVLFQGIDGLTEPYYEDGVIYLTLKELGESSSEMLAGFSGILHEQMSKSSNPLSLLLFSDALGSNNANDPFQVSLQRRLRLTNLALLLFSGLIVLSSYRNHIANFSQELADLTALGADKGHIQRMFLLEFTILFPFAALSAVTISWFVMRILYRQYLGNTASSVTVWEVFHMDPVNTALEILFYLLVCLCAIGISLRLPAPSSRRAARRSFHSLPRLWVHRTSAPFVWCLVIFIPLVTAFLLLFNRYLGIYALQAYSTQDAKISVTSANRGFTSEQLNSISKIPGIHRIERTVDSSFSYLLQVPRGFFLETNLHRYQEYAPGESDLEKYQVVAQIPEYEEARTTYYLCKDSLSSEYIELTLVKSIPLVHPKDGSEISRFDVYISNELMDELEAAATVLRLDIFTAPEHSAEIEAALRSQLPESYFVSNFQNVTDTSISRQEGRLWLLSWIFCILMIVAMQIVWVRLSKYVADCAFMLRIIQQVGASRQQLSRLIPVGFGAIPAAVLPFLIAIPWAWLDASRSNRPFIISGPVLAIYLGIVLLAIAAFWLPVKVTLKKILKDRK